jgi:mono/diheme cytochrome c family protein
MQRQMDRRDRQDSSHGGRLSRLNREVVKGMTLAAALVLAFSLVSSLAQAPAGKDLKVFYQQNCARCHGADGSALGDEGKKLKGRDLTNPDWQAKATDDAMVATILGGKFFGWAMPAFKDKLTQEEAQQMVTDIIRKSKKGQVIASGT